MKWFIRSPIAMLIVVGTALIAYTRTMRGQIDLMRHVARDDWRAVRDDATALLEPDGRRARGAVVDHAAVLLAVAHLVLGDLDAARHALDAAEQRSLAAPLRAALLRQRASLERITGQPAAAFRLLARPDATSTGDEWGVAAGRALTHLAALDGSAAAAAAREAAEPLERRLAGAVTPVLRRAFEADLVQVQCLLVRGLLLQGDLASAGAAWEARGAADGKPYVQGQLCETGARLAAARGDMATARGQADAARGWYLSVGAAIDVARATALLAGYARDRAALDSAAADVRRLGALGYLPEIERARLALGDDG